MRSKQKQEPESIISYNPENKVMIIGQIEL